MLGINQRIRKVSSSQSNNKHRSKTRIFGQSLFLGSLYFYVQKVFVQSSTNVTWEFTAVLVF